MILNLASFIFISLDIDYFVHSWKAKRFYLCQYLYENSFYDCDFTFKASLLHSFSDIKNLISFLSFLVFSLRLFDTGLAIFWWITLFWSYHSCFTVISLFIEQYSACYFCFPKAFSPTSAEPVDKNHSSCPLSYYFFLKSQRVAC